MVLLAAVVAAGILHDHHHEDHHVEGDLDNHHLPSHSVLHTCTPALSCSSSGMQNVTLNINNNKLVNIKYNINKHNTLIC